jgi:hypothetical protein
MPFSNPGSPPAPSSQLGELSEFVRSLEDEVFGLDKHKTVQLTGASADASSLSNVSRERVLGLWCSERPSSRR